MVLVCAPLVTTTVEEMERDMAKAKSLGADLVEIRLDFLHHFQPDIDLPRLISNRPLPVLVTFRYPYLPLKNKNCLKNLLSVEGGWFVLKWKHHMSKSNLFSFVWAN